jgi:excinuclease ABC subunit C
VTSATGRTWRDAAAEYFGPYLGGARVRLGVAGLLRVVPLHHTAENPAGLARALAARHGVAAADRDALADAAAAVLRREPAAVEALRRDLAARRDAAARNEAFELAASIHAEIEATDWVTAPQRVAGCAAADAAVSGWAGGLLTTFEIRSGRIRCWRVSRASGRRAALALGATPPDWREFADRNAALAAALALVPA